ncbi:GH36-type glycosyl hydrolase domain-containing protein [Cerasicoccus arenae]|uniref:Uncharacterized protein n=1 Tax=Cerasicoccus arenae TaxID=424488 RepID=A0A8J3DG34_9BACT|nr:hypothetical protein [Cerasicoccus arenae]MBK1859232.1 hypothetical protein [Cerasicoccus arenae]GHC02751.1 hypothetical protein GCM10007047_19270 [Cerasicoccus arenae]
MHSTTSKGPVVNPQQNSRIETTPWGYFDQKNREYVLLSPFSPRPWKNILWNTHYNTHPNQTTGGISYKREDSGETILLNWSGHKYFYLQNVDTGQLFSPGYSPICNRDFNNFKYRYGLNYSITEIEQYGLRLTITHTVDTENPVEYFETSLHNTGQSTATWRVIFYTDLALNQGSAKFQTANPFSSARSRDGHCLELHSLEPLTGKTRTAFLESSDVFGGALFTRLDFTGTYGNLTRPDALICNWPEADSAIEAPILCGYSEHTLCPGESKDLLIALGLRFNATGVDEPRFRSEQVRRSKDQQSKWFDDLYGKLTVSTPDPVFDLYTNTWIKHQLTYSAYWNRGWAKGFRDSNQDAWAFTLLDPQRSRKMILDCLPYQYDDGRTVRKWGPVDRDQYNDGGAWLIFATHAYLAETGDFELLEERAPFFESEEASSVYEHLKRGADYLWNNRGDRKLCLMPYGDWNDRLTGIGKDGKGQSVWTTMALAQSLRLLAEIAAKVGKANDAQSFEQRYRTVTDDLRREAWNGQWYSRAFTDAGHPVGTPDCAEGSIYLLPQAWSMISGIATEEQIPSVLEATYRYLQVDHGFRLLNPPYTRFDPSIGLLSSTPPGHLENGGNYCHGSMFMAYALGQSGRVDDALDTLKRILPINPQNPPSHSHQEPFSLTNSYYAPEAGKDSSGRSYFSWRTGTAGWAFRTAIESILGVVAGIDGLDVRAKLPSDWDRASMSRNYRNKQIQIEWKRTGIGSRFLNGNSINSVPIKAEQLSENNNLLEITF